MLQLTTLDAISRGIADLTGLEYAENLTLLAAWSNEISDICPLSGLTALTWLDLSYNEIEDISALSDLSDMGKLALQGNQISEISVLSGLTALTWLGLGDNEIEDISALSGLSDMEELYLQGNQISDISALSGLTALTELDLGFNEVSNISALSSMSNMEELGLQDNQISDISALAELTNLTLVALDWNEIRDICPLSWHLTNLTGLWLRNNPLDLNSYCACIPMIRENNPGIDLRYDPNPYVCPLQVEIDINPDTLNLKSKGKWITCYIRLPEGYELSDIDISSILLEDSLAVQHADIQDEVLMVKFDRQALIEYLDGTTGDVTLTVTGLLNDGKPFEATDTIRVINSGGKKK